MSKKRLIAVVAAGLLVGACGGSDSGTPSDDNNPNNNNNNNNGTPALKINAALGLYLVQAPAKNEGAVTGLVMVTDADDKAVSGATVKVNGVALPEDSLLKGFYDASKVQIPDTGADKTLTVSASSGTSSASLALKCPSEVTLTAPAENTAVSEGQQVTVSWTGKIDYNVALPLTVAGIHEYDSTENEVSESLGGDNTKDVTSGTSVQLTVPSSSDGYVAQLDVPGTFTMTNSNAGLCGLRRRVHLKKQ